MTNFEIQIIDFKTYKQEIIHLRKESWKAFHSNLLAEEFDDKKDELVDLSSLHCGLIVNDKLVATHRLQFINSITELPYTEKFKIPKTKNSNWYAYNFEENDYVKLTLPVAATGRLVIHPDYRKKGISKKILLFWIQLSKEKKIKTLLSYPSPWMLNSLLKVGFTYEKTLKHVFKPLPDLDVLLVKMNLN